MSSSGDIFSSRSWMYKRINQTTNEVSEEFCQGLEVFMKFAMNQPLFIETGKLFCPCIKCENGKLSRETTVSSHLYNRGFMLNYWVWISHGEDYDILNSNSHVAGETSRDDFQTEQENPYVDMVSDAYVQNMEEEPNPEAKRFYDILEAAKLPIYDGCTEGLSQLSLAARLMNLKTDYNLPQNCMDSISQMVKEYLPEGNTSLDSYYDTKKLLRSLGLPYHKIDVCQDNCMLFWKDAENEERCRFCKKDRFLPTKKLGRKRVAYRQMFYLPVADRLKRLYQSRSTAVHMRWHAEHLTKDKEMSHPSDGEAWKHFNEVFPDFAKETRNIYLGLCTDGFNPFGMSGHNYSLWPVIMTPYNLPPEMCMKQEYMFLTVLVPGPNHPKRSLDIFLQPLIDELKDLWSNGVQAFDISTKQNFLLKAVLMWTISDFPAYGMLSGWTTHGRLACPYCMDETNAFQLKNGRKTSWFDCHRCFLPSDHSYRRNKKSFKRGRAETGSPPQFLTGVELWQRHVNGLPKTVDCGGNHGRIQGYGDTHNWHKQSIFWELPYWKYHKLRHNLDVMHIEKNFWDNIINTLLNVQGKTKDDIKSRLDLKEYCNRKELHLTSDGKAPVPIFRLQADEKKTFLQWLKEDVKFSDGYASSISGCVDLAGGKLTGMKSHDCHVFMQRLLPVAFAELLDKSVHEALSGISSFFRDICARTLHKDGVRMLHQNIATVLCNLEKIFPPSFFNVMEHLPVHLPHEAQLGGPVQFRWMYPFERYMYHLKKKVKNKAKVEGSIVEQYVNEEISTFCSYYFESHIKTKGRTEARHYEGGDDQYTHQLGAIPDIFSQRGRSSGKAKDIWLQTKDYHHAHTYVLLNCEQLRPFERLFDEIMTADHPGISDDDLITLKEKEFANWLQKHVEENCIAKSYPEWLQSLAHGPMIKVTSWPIYFSRGYTFHTYDHGKEKKTANYGVCVKGTSSCGSSDEPDFYGILREILELNYPGPVDLKVVVFFCDWYDSTSGRGIRRNKSGIIDVNVTRRYGKYDPFILASQADQVCYVPYPRVTRKRDQQWEAAIVIQPRGRILVNGNLDFTAMQSENDSPVMNVDSVQVETLTNLHGQAEYLNDVSDNDESGSDDEDGNSDIEVSEEESD